MIEKPLSKTEKQNLPVYLCIVIKKNARGVSFYEGDLCQGENLDSPSSLIEGVKNKKFNSLKKVTDYNNSFVFNTLNLLIERAIETYNEGGYNSGLILVDESKKKSIDNRVIVPSRYDALDL